ncbi:hypothetical protein AB9K34_04505 [Sedimentitalea sp. XS_ASV28]|uniref:hypothetical protein n=1 Tax=Sedimentitalea sp. XS_ASV28 TaxID=3241296 RepID=UPI003513562C
MADLLQEIEAIPTSYPNVQSGLTARDAAVAWQRIEAYTRTRYTAREVVWTFEGREGEGWTPPLSPVTAHMAEKWEGGAWVSVTLADGPVGLCLPSDGVFRVTAQVGDGNQPAAVSEAFRRLAEYMADDTDRAGVSSYSVNMGGAIQESYQRSAAHAARALQNSGAADLLRPYRRQK